MAANGISELSTKEARQIAKLNLAQTKRQAVGAQGYRTNNVYDIDTLSAKYIGNDVATDLTPLVDKRPWTSSI